MASVEPESDSVARSAIDDQAFFLLKYQQDRIHETELERATNAYELAFFRGLFILNGGSAAAFVTVAAGNLAAARMHPVLTASALVIWIVGLAVAALAGWEAYSAQHAFTRILRTRNTALALRLHGRHDPIVLLSRASDTEASLMSSAARRQRQADDRWDRARRIGSVSTLLFVAGVALAGFALLGSS